MKQIVVLTGQAGAGRSVATDALEDLGWHVIDNLPSMLIPELIELIDGRFERLALALPGYEPGTVEQIQTLRDGAADVSVVFLEASTEVLVRRYTATKRRHPFTVERHLADAIRFDRDQSVSVRTVADLVIDTSDLNPYQLRDRIAQHVDSRDDGTMQVTVMSFGFKHGLPRDVDMVIDCRFLPNPYWEADLRDMTGLDPQVQKYVTQLPVAQEFFSHLDGLVKHLLPAYELEGRSYLTIALGCTGGRHRSVTIAEQLASSLREVGATLRVAHRDIER